jgi:hypothetical protein
MKRARRTRRSKTHFEQVPLAAVRKVTRPDTSTNPSRRRNLVVEPSTTKTEPYSLQFVPLYRSPIRHR